MNYESVVATRRGGPEVLQIVENDLRAPAPGEARVKVLATSVGRTDVDYRYGRIAFAPKAPFVPGYEVLGRVDAVGAGVTQPAVGDRVAALTGHGGYAEYIYLRPEHLAPVPPGLDPAEAVTLILNYVTAHQMLHRTAKAKAGQRALVIGASGGVGTALLQLGKLAGLTLYGLASAAKHAAVKELGATPIDYRSPDFSAELRRLEPNGVDFVFNGFGSAYTRPSLKLIRRGGKLVEFVPTSGGLQLVVGLAQLALLNLWPNGKAVEFYGISALYQVDKRPFMTDLPILFRLLADGKIKPCIAARLPLLEAAKGNALLESGAVTGQVVLLAPELL